MLGKRVVNNIIGFKLLDTKKVIKTVKKDKWSRNKDDYSEYMCFVLIDSKSKADIFAQVHGYNNFLHFHSDTGYEYEDVKNKFFEVDKDELEKNVKTYKLDEVKKSNKNILFVYGTPTRMTDLSYNDYLREY